MYKVYSRKKWLSLILCFFLIFLSSVSWLIYIYINRIDIKYSLSWQKLAGGGDPSLYKFLKSHFIGTQEVFVSIYYSVSSQILKILSRWIPGIFIILSIFLVFRKIR